MFVCVGHICMSTYMYGCMYSGPGLVLGLILSYHILFAVKCLLESNALALCHAIGSVSSSNQELTDTASLAKQANFLSRSAFSEG